ncbi:MAG: thiamine pyrophosphate-binding protein [Candidatus Hodarchaeota archaeon]
MTNREDLEKEVTIGFGIIHYLKEKGVKYIFGIPDGHTMEMYDAMRELDGIDHVLVNDERTAGFAADAYSRVTGTLGVCDAGSAGSMNFPVAAVEAKGSGSPVLFMSSAIRTYLKGMNVAHDINIIDTFKAITKWAEIITKPKDAPEILKKALSMAMNDGPGPVGLVLPQDVLAENKLHSEKFLNPDILDTGSSKDAIEGDIDKVVGMILDSKQPVIFTGEGALASGIFAEIESLSKMLKAPVFTTISGKGIMKSRQYEDNLYFGIVGLFGLRPNHHFINERADLVIVVGNRLNEGDTAYFKFPNREQTIIHIDNYKENLSRIYKSTNLLGNQKNILSRIIKKLKETSPLLSSEILTLRENNITWLKKKYKFYHKANDKKWMFSQPIKPQRVLKAISEAMEENDYLVTEASASSRWIGTYFPVKSVGRTIITPKGVGPTGFGIGGLIGTHFGLRTLHGEKKVPNIVLLTGDGALMNGGLSDLETIQKYEIDCTIVVLNNSSLGYVKYGQAFIYANRFYETDRPTTNFADFAVLFGGKGKVIEKLEDLDAAMKDAIPSKGLKILDIRVDRAELLPRNFYL